jgi:hypothetical protein
MLKQLLHEDFAIEFSARKWTYLKNKTKPIGTEIEPI